MITRIADFLEKQTAASISCVNELNEPFSFSCFFVYNRKENLLYYKSSPSAYHSRILLENPKVAGTIMPDKLNKLFIKGVQFKGEVLADNHPLCMDAGSKYHFKLPLATAIPGVVCTIQLNELRMTNNNLGVIQKFSWQREEKVNAEG
jgi:uncharacterized protein